MRAAEFWAPLLAGCTNTAFLLALINGDTAIAIFYGVPGCGYLLFMVASLFSHLPQRLPQEGQ